MVQQYELKIDHALYGVVFERQAARPAGELAAQHDECVKVQVRSFAQIYVPTINTHGCWVNTTRWAFKAGYL
ncbi:hypothetical protein GO730_10625 [Spirosoma sp. HMF3257]|uniref:Uncharacterized protein n=1 Tax=Spirosoma telluris TaxID=2183553 RepID=A0A327NID3_9BACT|nr:hypothetical protein [Spirosoma telluris]RAI74603.1 hypothetical protein HMF3257_10560 [Spirosoma telluris]